MPRVNRRASCQRAQRRSAPTTRVAAPPAAGRGRGRGTRRPATLPTPSMARGSRRSANPSQSLVVGPTGPPSNHPDHEPPHDLEYLHSIIRAEVQQALAAVASQTANNPATTQLAPPSSSASAAPTTSTTVESSGTMSSQQSGQLTLLRVRACRYAWRRAVDFDGRGVCACVRVYARVGDRVYAKGRQGYQ